MTQLGHRLRTAWAARCAEPLAGEDDFHLNAAVDWLLNSQRAPREGYAHSYHFLRGWLPPYPETTGYIIPTLLAVNGRLRRDAALASAERALHWLHSIQAEEGCFAALSGEPLVFDTGQILIGMNAAAITGLSEYRRNAHERAATWLANVQADDGSFPRFAYNNRLHAYYSRVGAALIAAGQILGQARFIEAGRRNLDWTADRLGANGFFQLSSFDGGPAYLHTIVYVLEGLIDGHKLLRVERWIEAALACAAALADRIGTTIPRSQYRSDWSVANDEYCVTGVAQWAGVCYRLAQDHGHASLIEHAHRAVDQVKRWQFISPSPEIHGGLPGSVPLTGRYMRLSIPNWGVKFFADALLLRSARAEAA